VPAAGFRLPAPESPTASRSATAWRVSAGRAVSSALARGFPRTTYQWKVRHPNLRGSAMKAVASLTSFARIAAARFCGGTITSPAFLPFRPGPLLTSRSLRQPCPSIMRAGAIRGSKFEPIRSKNVAEALRLPWNSLTATRRIREVLPR